MHFNEIEVTSSDPYSVSWFRELAGGKLSHQIGFAPLDSQLSPEHVQSLVLRMACYFLIDRVPDRALPELCENVAEVYDYHSLTPPNLPPAFTARVQTAPALPGLTLTRPEFELSDE
jgi:hypothetical protein